jgi:DNA polymerase III subunit epsilon
MAPLLPRWLDTLRRPRVRPEALAGARLVALDLETTGPDMYRDEIIAVGAIAVCGGAVQHGQCFERLLRQAQPSADANILIHRIGGQRQLAGDSPAAALDALLGFVGDSLVVAFRAAFDATVLQRALRTHCARARCPAFVDLALLLPACFPGTANDTLDDWVAQFGLPLPERHAALADAHACAQLLLPVLERAHQMGSHDTASLCAMARAQRWLGRRR